MQELHTHKNVILVCPHVTATGEVAGEELCNRSPVVWHGFFAQIRVNAQGRWRGRRRRERRRSLEDQELAPAGLQRAVLSHATWCAGGLVAPGLLARARRGFLDRLRRPLENAS